MPFSEKERAGGLFCFAAMKNKKNKKKRLKS